MLLTINNPTPEIRDNFGIPVADTINGNILVGAHNDNTNATHAGSVYLFDGTLRGITNTPLLTINNPTPEIQDYFGHSVASTPDGNILVGAFGDKTNADYAGSAYLFDENGNLLLTINNPTPEIQDNFGYFVASTPDGNILVGARFDDTGATDTGSVYLFDGKLRGITNTPLLTINNPTPDVNDRFGETVASTSDGNILVGTANAGSAYLFDGKLRGIINTPLLTINNPTPDVNDHFGLSVAGTTEGDILVGARQDNADTGSAYLFDGTLRGITNTPLLTINNPTPESGDWFGHRVTSTINGDILVSASYDNTGATDAGSVYLFEGMSTLYCGEPESFYNVINGTELSDYLVGTNSPDLIFGNGGNDMIYSIGENNCIYAGDGTDFVLAHKDGNTVYGGAGNDSIMLKGTGIAYAEDGDDSIYIIKPSVGHLLDGRDGSDSCVANVKQPINTIHCELVKP